jgi:hypothetical protein
VGGEESEVPPAVGGWELADMGWPCDGELQPVKNKPATSNAQANNPRTNNFMGANPCESGDAINTFV